MRLLLAIIIWVVGLAIECLFQRNRIGDRDLSWISGYLTGGFFVLALLL